MIEFAKKEIKLKKLFYLPRNFSILKGTFPIFKIHFSENFTLEIIKTNFPEIIFMRKVKVENFVDFFFRILFNFLKNLIKNIFY